MTNNQVVKLAKDGESVRSIAKKSGLNRKDVEAILEASKKTSAKKTFRTLPIVIGMVLAVAAIAVVSQLKSSPWIDKDSHVFQEFFQEREITTAEDFQGDMKRFAPFAKEKGEWINEMYVTGKDITGIQNIERRFAGKTALALFSHGRVSYSKVEHEKLVNGAMPIAFFSENDPTDLSKFNPGSRFSFNRENNAIEIMISDVSKVWFQALLVHEMTHADRYFSGFSNDITSKDKLAAAYAREEVITHAVQRDYLNAATSGAYGRAIESVLDEMNAKDLHHVWKRISVADLDRIDKVFGKSSRFDAEVRLSQYLGDIAHYWNAQRYSGDELRLKEIEVYQKFNRSFEN